MSRKGQCVRGKYAVLLWRGNENPRVEEDNKRGFVEDRVLSSTQFRQELLYLSPVLPDRQEKPSDRGRRMAVRELRDGVYSGERFSSRRFSIAREEERRASLRTASVSPHARVCFRRKEYDGPYPADRAPSSRGFRPGGIASCLSAMQESFAANQDRWAGTPLGFPR